MVQAGQQAQIEEQEDELEVQPQDMIDFANDQMNNEFEEEEDGQANGENNDLHQFFLYDLPSYVTLDRLVQMVQRKLSMSDFSKEPMLTQVDGYFSKARVFFDR